MKGSLYLDMDLNIIWLVHGMMALQAMQKSEIEATNLLAVIVAIVYL